MPAADTLNAFCEHGLVERRGNATGALAGLRFALKDVFDLAGVPTGDGSPDWLATHPVPTRSAPIVDLLLDAGATLVGKTKMDELAWSLIGENAHYGTPVNVAAPGRVPGGSSSGSAAAVAGKLADFAIGSDTGGSVRLPASFCGIYGIRPTHARILTDGGVPLAPSYDSVGWFARDPRILERVGQVLIPDCREAKPFTRVAVATDLLAAAGAGASRAVAASIERLGRHVGHVGEVDVAEGRLKDWVETFRVAQAHEVWQTHGAWVQQTHPKLGPGVRDRFAAAAALEPEQVRNALSLRAEIRERMRALVADGTLLVFPTAPGPAPLRGLPGDALQSFRMKALELLCPAGHAGLPQISMPLGTIDGLPIGLSAMAQAKRDEDLLDLAVQIA